MKEFIEKLIGRLEELSIPIYDSDGEIENKVVFTDIAKNIVNELAEKYKNTNIITDFLQYARDNADNYDTNEGWSLADLIDLSIEFTEKYSANTPQNSADGWIPCSERLPEEHDSIFAEYKGTDKWRKGMFEKISDDVNVTVQFENGERRTMTHHTVDGRWPRATVLQSEVIAWMPLPAPYKEGE